MDAPVDAERAPAPVAEMLPTRRPPTGVWRQSWFRFRRNRAGLIGLFLVSLVVLTAIIGPVLAPFDPNDQSAMLHGASRHAPNAVYWLGTDRVGYDVLSRTIYGAPTALAVGLGAMLIASSIGVVIGGLAGYFGGLVGEALMRFTEFFMVVPVFVVILAVVRLFGIVVVGTPLERIPNLNLITIIVLLGLFEWPSIARMARAEFLRLRRAEFVEADGAEDGVPGFAEVGAACVGEEAEAGGCRLGVGGEDAANELVGGDHLAFDGGEEVGEVAVALDQSRAGGLEGGLRELGFDE